MNGFALTEQQQHQSEPRFVPAREEEEGKAELGKIHSPAAEATPFWFFFRPYVSSQLLSNLVSVTIALGEGRKKVWNNPTHFFHTSFVAISRLLRLNEHKCLDENRGRVGTRRESSLVEPINKLQRMSFFSVSVQRLSSQSFQSLFPVPLHWL